MDQVQASDVILTCPDIKIEPLKIRINESDDSEADSEDSDYEVHNDSYPACRDSAQPQGMTQGTSAL